MQKAVRIQKIKKNRNFLSSIVIIDKRRGKSKMYS